MRNSGKRFHFKSSHIAGFQYYDGCIVFSQLSMGTMLELVREEDNRYDPCAVAIYFDGEKLGYIPREDNEQISQFLDMGYTDLFEVRICRITPDVIAEKQIGINIYIRRKKSVL